MLKKLKMTILLCLLGGALMNAQTIKVTGTVTDASNGEKLVGVFVLQEGTQNGVSTDLDGNYSISVPSGARLKFSSMGYKEFELNATEKTINVALKQSAEFLEETVLVGYRIQKKRDVLGSIGVVDSDKIAAVPVSSVQQTLQGRVAGVSVATQTGAPGATVNVRIRGTNSISSSNSPLYIVDGIPVEGALDNIAAADIENMTVLKDASSAAIYGSRASNGVILITTKSGKAGSAKVNYNMQSGVQFHGHLTEMCNTEEYINIYNEAARNDNATVTEEIRKRTLIEGKYLKDYPNVNHLEEIFQVAPITQHDLSISGGTDKTQYIVSGTYFYQDGIIKETNYNRANLRSSVNSRIKDWLKVGLNVSGSISNTRSVSSSGDGYVSEGGSVVRYALYRNPALPVYDANGGFVDLPSEYYGETVYNTFFGDGYSPEGLCVNTDRTNKAKTLIATGNILINFADNIFLNTTGGVDYKYNTLRVFNPTWGTGNRINATNSLNLTNTEKANWTVNSTFNHNMTFGKNNISYIAGVEAIHESAKSCSMSESYYTDTNPDVLYIGLGEKENQASQGESAASLLSFFASVNYSYAKKYYFSGTIREDGSSRFSKGNRWGTFYSLSAGWNLEQEDWLNDKSWLNILKLRAGYGSIGNQNIGLYAYADRYSTHYYYAFDGGASNGYAQTSLGNDNLKWETSNQLNIGVDIEVLDNTLGASVDYFHKVTKDMLVQETLPLSSGYMSAPWINNGSVLNTGVDFELFYRRSFHDWGFDINLNGGYLHNEVLSLETPIMSGRVGTGKYATKTVVGQPIGAFYLYKMDGIFQNELEIITSAYQGRDIVPGDVKYADINSDGVINENDRTYCGSAIPTFTTGINMAFWWKGFDLSMFFQGAFGQKIFSQIDCVDIECFCRGFNVTKRYYENHWTGEGTSNTYPRASWNGYSNNGKMSTKALYDGSYLRLKNIQFGYTFKTSDKWGLRLYLAGTNLLTFTGYNGLDPEMTVSTNSASEGDRANGIDWGTYPVAKSVTLGLNLKF